MRVLRWFIARPVRRATALWLAGMAVVPLAVAQRVQGAQAARAVQAGQSAQSAQAAQSANMAGPRFEEACQSAARSGRPMPGCGPAQSVPGNELEQLKQEALRTRNPQLMTMVGDAYQKGRAGMGDISQAYRWYVLGAVRGDPQAMARLSEIYRRGQGTAPDRVKAVGYAKLAQRVAPDSPAGKQAAQTVHALSKGMAQKELAQAERFAEELARQMGQGAGGVSGASPSPLGDKHRAWGGAGFRRQPLAGRVPRGGAARGWRCKRRRHGQQWRRPSVARARNANWFACAGADARPCSRFAGASSPGSPAASSGGGHGCASANTACSGDPTD